METEVTLEYPAMSYSKGKRQTGSHREHVREVIDLAILDQVTKKNVIAHSSKNGAQRKDLKDMGIQ